MCGITGFVGASALRSGGPTETVRLMAGTLRHRGPDDFGIWVDPEPPVALGHTRLSIIDLSDQGHQPMQSASGQYVIVFNGEIYNFQALRQSLERAGTRFRGCSDTEVLLEAIARWGVEVALARVNGMFAFALWDRRNRRLTLARDRLGEKPLYYGWMGQTFVFASEMKALLTHPATRIDIDRGALTLFMRHNYVPTPYSIFQGVAKLPPGTSLTVRADRPWERPEALPYWSARSAAEDGCREPLDVSPKGAVDRLDTLLRESVAMRLVSDVPLGAFLSGGIDSSTIVALMQAEAPRAARTFTIGFHEARYDEAGYARAVARHLGTDHTELYVTPEDALTVIPSLPTVYDEPFADSSQIPTILLSRLARREVTVALSGDGGDELFGGYDRYRLHGHFSWIIRHLPGSFRARLAGVLTSLPPNSWEQLSRLGVSLGAKRLMNARVGDRAHKFAEVIRSQNTHQLYKQLMSNWVQPASAVRDGYEPATPFSEAATVTSLVEPTHRLMYLDTITYLPDDILTKVDRASMSVGLEVRVPLLDHRVVEFAWRLAPQLKLRNGSGKWILRQLLHRYVPPHLVERPKMGFAVPIGHWLRGPLRPWAEELLARSRLEDEGLLQTDVIRRTWLEHLNGERDWKFALWNVLMFQAWWESVRARSAARNGAKFGALAASAMSEVRAAPSPRAIVPD